MGNDTETIYGIKKTLQDAKDALRVAEQTAAALPKLRRDVKILERALASLTTAPTPRRNTGPTIKDAIFDALEAAGGRIEFAPGKMAATVAGLTGGKRNSVQVEIHRLRSDGRIGVDRDEDNRPIALYVVRKPLTAIAGGAGEATAEV